MQRGPLYKKTPFTMKGYSYPGKSPIKETSYFKTSLFTDPHNTYKMTDEELMAPHLAKREAAENQGKHISKDGTYDYGADPKYAGTGLGSFLEKQRLESKKQSPDRVKRTMKSKDAGRGGDTLQDMYAMSMGPFGWAYLAGKSLANLFHGKKKDIQIAEDIAKQEKKVNLKVNKELMAKGRRAQYKTKGGKVMSSKQMKGEFDRRKKPLGKDYKLGDLSKKNPVTYKKSPVKGNAESPVGEKPAGMESTFDVRKWRLENA